MNKSKAIREYLANHPDAATADVVAALEKKGMKGIYPALVSTVKSNMKKAGQKTALTVADLQRVQNFANEIGGLPVLKEAIAALEDLSRISRA